MKIQKSAKEAGFDATNCLFCHNEKLPAKGKVTNNARGEFLVKQKEAKKAKEIDVAWALENWRAHLSPEVDQRRLRHRHFYEAILATASILVWHFYMVIFDPEV